MPKTDCKQSMISNIKAGKKRRIRSADGLTPMDIVLEADVGLQEKLEAFISLTEITKKHDIGINEYTTSRLIELYENNETFCDFFIKYLEYAIEKKRTVFVYKHLYRLVIQIWMEVYSRSPSLEIRKKIIARGLNNEIPLEIIMKIHRDIDDWFSPANLNSDVKDLVEWLCQLDNTKLMAKMRDSYQKVQLENLEKHKEFKKKNKMTMDEYRNLQEAAKKEGACKYKRNNKECPFGVNCKFYHGDVEHTYGVQPCIMGEKCTLLREGKCHFVHRTSAYWLPKKHQMYRYLKPYGNNFITEKIYVPEIDEQIYNNPFVILKKSELSASNSATYTVPRCCHKQEIYGIEKICDRPVCFATREDKKIKNYYCCYEHMIASEPNVNNNFVVKQHTDN